jgi:hypothetical protein
MKGWVGPRASRGVLEKRKIFLSLAGFVPRLVQLVQGTILTMLGWFTILRVPCVKRGKACLKYMRFQFFFNYS